jgi:putative DNA primase/helicase
MDNIDGMVQERIEKEAAVMSIETSMSAEDTIPPGFVHDCLHQNERGDGILYAYLQKGRFVYNNNTGEMMEWAGHFWRMDKDEASMEAVEDVARVYEEEAYRLWDEIRNCTDPREQKRLEDIQEVLRKRAAKLRSNRGVESCIKFAKRVRDPELKLTVDGNQFDARPWLLACKNGVIDLKTGKFRDGKQEEYISKACPVEFKDINEFSQKWEDAVKQIYNGDEEIVAYIQRLFGYGITGLTSEHIFPVFQGRGRNGKSMLIEVISHVLGPLVAPIRSEMLLAQPFGKNSSAPLLRPGPGYYGAERVKDGCRFRGG